MTYRTLTIANLPATPDGTLVLVTGTYARSVTGATLSDADTTIELSGEPFDWSPRHDTRLDV